MKKIILQHELDIIDIRPRKKIEVVDISPRKRKRKTKERSNVINLEDMLQNGTVISETLIEKPHSFSTACTVTTQIIAQVASSQYGGQSISLAHLAPFVQITREKYRKQFKKIFETCDIHVTDDQFDYIVEQRVLEEVEKGIQTIQYQLVTLMTTNG